MKGEPFDRNDESREVFVVEPLNPLLHSFDGDILPAPGLDEFEALEKARQ
jgi:hypothetical protein